MLPPHAPASCATTTIATPWPHELPVGACNCVPILLARANEPELPAPVLTPASLTLDLEPLADCARYDTLRMLEVL